MKSSNSLSILATFAAMAAWTLQAQLAHVPGAKTEVFATLNRPTIIDSTADGTLFVGQDSNSTSGERIYRITPNGEVAPFGDQLIRDPDAVVVDRSGGISGIPGAILAGGSISGITRITPAGEVSSLFPWTATIANPEDMIVDRNGRLLIANGTVEAEHALLVSTGSTPVVLTAAIVNPVHLTEDAEGRILVTGSSDDVWLISADGAVISSNYVPLGRPLGPLATSKGSTWGMNSYTVNSDGELLRIDRHGGVSVMGTDFGDAYDIHFADDGTLYVSELNANRILKITPPLVASIVCSAVDICWNSTANETYQVQYRSELNTGQWEDLGEAVLGTGTPMCVTDSIRDQPRRHYRVVELP